MNRIIGSLTGCRAAAGIGLLFCVAAAGPGFPGEAAADVLGPLSSIPFEEVTSPAGTGSGSPNLTVGNGTVYLTWVEAADLRVSTWDGTAWTAPLTITSDGDLAAGWANAPAFLALGDGTLVAAWLRKAGGEEATEVWVSTSKDGGKSWAAPLKPHHDGTKTEHGFVSLMPDPVEGFWVVWLDGRNHAEGKVGKKTQSPNTELRAAQWRGGSFGKEEVLDKRVCDCCQTAGGRTLEGLAVAYRDRSQQEIRDISVIRYERRVWSQPFTLHSDNWKIQGCPVSGPSMASRDSLMALSWFTDADDQPKVYVALSDSSAFALSRIVQVDDGHPLGRADVQWLPDESVLVTWAEQVGDSAEIRARRVTLTGQKDPAMTLASTTVDRSSGSPTLAAQSTNVWMAWTDRASEPGKVRIGRLDLTKWE